MNESILQTEHLFVRDFLDSDSAEVMKIFGDAEVMKYIGGVWIKESSEKAAIAKLNDFTRRQRSGYGMWAVASKATDKVVGHLGVRLLHGSDDTEIGFIIDSDLWGKGLASEIASAAVTYCFDKLSLQKVVAVVEPENRASVRVLKKIGFQQNGEFRHPELDHALDLFELRR